MSLYRRVLSFEHNNNILHNNVDRKQGPRTISYYNHGRQFQKSTTHSDSEFRDVSMRLHIMTILTLIYGYFPFTNSSHLTRKIVRFLATHRIREVKQIRKKYISIHTVYVSLSLSPQALTNEVVSCSPWHSKPCLVEGAVILTVVVASMLSQCKLVVDASFAIYCRSALDPRLNTL
jgi:hypothetical protein